MTWRPAISCDGKKVYETFRHASFDAKEMQRKERVALDFIEAYRCRQCGKFHVGGRTRTYRKELDRSQSVSLLANPGNEDNDHGRREG